MTESLENNLHNPQSYEVGPISQETEAQAKRGWEVFINGEKIDRPIETVRLINQRMQVEVDYGQRPEGFDGPVLKEPGGGGSVIVPYVIHEGQLYIAVAEEKRPTMTDGVPLPILNVPRGFLDPNETHFETAKRELAEETGYIPLEKRIKEVEGDPMNPNSTFFVTGKDKGVRVFSTQVLKDETRVSNPSEDLTEIEFEFNPNVIRTKEGASKTADKVMHSRFIHWTKAVKLGDMFTNAAVARLFLETQNQPKNL